MFDLVYIIFHYTLKFVVFIIVGHLTYISILNILC